MMTFDFTKGVKVESKNNASVLNKKLYIHAQQCGILNLSNRHLESVPSIVWELNTPLPPESNHQTVDFDNPSGDTRWWETQPITKLILASNNLTAIEGSIRKLDTLTHLDLHDNELSALPDEIEHLRNLKTLLLSYNKLKVLPTNISNIQNLTILDLANNHLVSLTEDISSFSHLERLDLSKNALTKLPSKLPPRLRHLNVQNNRLEQVPEGFIENLNLLTILDLSSNQLNQLVLDRRPPNTRSTLHLSILHVDLNCLPVIPDVAGLTELKELHLSDNRITVVNLSCLQDCSITTLELARNSIREIPEGISKCLPNLIRLDISSNELTSLPTELGFMDSLMVLIINCNSIRSIRQSIISGSTEAIKSLLRQRHKSSDEDFEYTLQSVKNCLDTVKSEANKESIYSTNGINDNNVNSVVSSMKSLLSDQKQNPIIHYEIHLPPVSSSGILDWSGVTQKSSTTSVTNIPQLPSLNVQSEWIQAATPPNSQGNIPVVKSLLLLHRSLLQVPQGLFVFASDLTSLNISYNQLTSLPENLDQLTKLGSLDVSNNKLRCLPVCLSNLSELITLRLDSNPFASQLPYDILFKIPLIKKLECLSVRGCQLDSCPTYEHLNPTNAPNLKCLDIGNNNIGQLPVELGLCTQIRSLHVDGNTFRVPRSSIVAKGTESILDYLRSRIPT